MNYAHYVFFRLSNQSSSTVPVILIEVFFGLFVWLGFFLPEVCSVFQVFIEFSVSEGWLGFFVCWFGFLPQSVIGKQLKVTDLGNYSYESCVGYRSQVTI